MSYKKPISRRPVTLKSINLLINVGLFAHNIFLDWLSVLLLEFRIHNTLYSKLFDTIFPNGRHRRNGLIL